MGGREKRQIWIGVIFLSLAVSCFFLRGVVYELAQEQCNEDPSLKLDFSSVSCASENTEFLYKTFGASFYVFLVLALTIPLVMYFRHRHRKQRGKHSSRQRKSQRVDRRRKLY